jgi:hypothetical protein
VNFVKFSKAALAFSSFSSKINQAVVDRLEVKITHINIIKFDGFVSIEYAKHLIYKALVLDLANHHGASFRREKIHVELFISFKLKQGIEPDLMRKLFSCVKPSKTGRINSIIVEVVYPFIVDKEVSTAKLTTSTLLHINGCNYKLTEEQIHNQMVINDEIKGELEEEVVMDEVDGTQMGKGAYIYIIKLPKRMKNMILCLVRG